MDMWTNAPPNNTWTKTMKKYGQSKVEKDLGETFEDVWTSRTEEFTIYQEEAYKE